MSEIIKSIYQGAIANVFHFTVPPTTAENVNTGYEAGDFVIVNNSVVYQLVDEVAGTWVQIYSGFSSYPPSFSNPLIVTLNSNVDDWSPTGFDNTVDCIIITGNSNNVNITGIDYSNFVAGQGLILINAKDPNAIVKLYNNDSNSLPENRMLLTSNIVNIKYGIYYPVIRNNVLNRWSGQTI